MFKRLTSTRIPFALIAGVFVVFTVIVKFDNAGPTGPITESANIGIVELDSKTYRNHKVLDNVAPFNITGVGKSETEESIVNGWRKFESTLGYTTFYPANWEYAGTHPSSGDTDLFSESLQIKEYVSGSSDLTRKDITMDKLGETISVLRMKKTTALPSHLRRNMNFREIEDISSEEMAQHLYSNNQFITLLWSSTHDSRGNEAFVYITKSDGMAASYSEYTASAVFALKEEFLMVQAAIAREDRSSNEFQTFMKFINALEISNEEVHQTEKHPG